ncbi:hypothetical protein LCL99_19720 [Halomonas denitrificans]|uniref:PssE/Cps14G family polysaccharide biosynthesis glycosyltransferase n=1 Tax=Halomonas denitrificans TaxID=370769 RepID=UPI001CD78DC3|nr:PssE/Cps14G family polysaccharide biosynthesis glycosyltransferase [Halomonas denitrificans]MCA0976702.1 hypothetical protein [Halomonas denitrificans]
MNIFVTVGTTSFPSLIDAALVLASKPDISLRIQDPDFDETRNASCLVKNFFSDVVEQYSWADLVVTHAGAGSVYKCLEMRKKIIVVPNFERADRHQNELAQYVHDNNYGAVLWGVDNLESVVDNIFSCSFAMYVKTDFFVKDELVKIINHSMQ